MRDKLNFKLILDSDQLDPSKLEKSILSLEREVIELNGVEKIVDDHANKDIDPLLFATLSISLAPIVTTKFFEFLNAWSLRRENRLIKIKLQLSKDEFIEFEGSETMSKQEVEAWVLAIKKTLKSKR